ncbi:MAG: glutamate synthase subunit beta [Bacteroidales bacterium]
MGDPLGFLKVARKEAGNRPVKERIDDFGEVEQTLNPEDRKLQASRCMDCGVPFCHWACPLASHIPEWQDALFRNNWKEASEMLHMRNEFPEFTGRVCPALCEKSCVLAIHNEAVTIRENEAAVVEKAFERGWIIPRPPQYRTGKKVALVGSGPAGLTLSVRLNRMGHSVDVLEKESRPGGLLRYGIPDFKLNKRFIDRRLEILQAEGIVFCTGICVGRDVSVSRLLKEYDAVVLAIGAGRARDLVVPGRKLQGIHFAMDYLVQQNKVNAGMDIPDAQRIHATGKQVVVIGGGDTGSDCVGTAVRQNAASVTQVEILPRPPMSRPPDNHWPFWPEILRTSSSHEEGCRRLWSMKTLAFEGNRQGVQAVRLEQVRWKREETGQWYMGKTVGTQQRLAADLVLLAVGFISPVFDGLPQKLKGNSRGNSHIRVNEKYMTNIPGLFAAGDAVTGASLVAQSMAGAMRVAEEVHRFISGHNTENEG